MSCSLAEPVSDQTTSTVIGNPNNTTNNTTSDTTSNTGNITSDAVTNTEQTMANNSEQQTEVCFRLCYLCLSAIIVSGTSQNRYMITEAVDKQY